MTRRAKASPPVGGWSVTPGRLALSGAAPWHGHGRQSWFTPVYGFLYSTSMTGTLLREEEGQDKVLKNT